MARIQGKPCEISNHKYINQTKGIIYIKEYDIEDVVQFKAYLQENYEIAEVAKAPFIKTRSPETNAFMITFNTTILPETIYIPGEKTDSVVYPFKNRPLMCRTCQQYGHSIKYCKSVTRCRRCGQQGHERKDGVNQICCVYCKLSHEAGDRECAIQQKEQLVCDIQQKRHVNRKRARQIAEHGDCEEESTRRHTFLQLQYGCAA